MGITCVCLFVSTLENQFPNPSLKVRILDFGSIAIDWRREPIQAHGIKLPIVLKWQISSGLTYQYTVLNAEWIEVWGQFEHKF